MRRCPRCSTLYEEGLRCVFDGSTLELAELRLDGRFELVAELAAGSIGRVYRARDVSNGRLLAVRVLADRFRSSPVFRERFLEEARATMRLEHDNVVRVYGTSRDTEDCVYMAMELVDGSSLAELAKDRTVHVRELRQIARQIASALEKAHSVGVLHRHIKPTNILVDRGRAVLVDFGLACIPGEVGVTRFGNLIGSPATMAPEQASGLLPTPAVDWYALGCVLFEARFGVPPFVGAADTVLASHLCQPITLPARSSTLHRDYAELDSAIEGLLSKDPDARRPAFEQLLHMSDHSK